MKKLYEILKLSTSYGMLVLATACGSSGSTAIDSLFGSAAPILTSVPDQIVSQEDLLHIDINNIKNGVPGDDKDMSYTCMFDGVVDGVVDAGQACENIPNSSVTFAAATGILEWTPHSGILGNYEVNITGNSSAGKYSEIFTVGVRLKFNGIGLYSNISGTSVNVTWTPNLDAQGYQVYKLNSMTGQYEVLKSITGGSTSGTTLTGLTPNTGYTMRVQAIDVLGNPDGNVVSRSFTTTELTKFSLSPAIGTVAAGTPFLITVHAFNANGTPQTVGGVPITAQIQSGTSSGNFSAVTDHDDGSYTFTFTPTTVGGPIKIEITTNSSFFLNNTTDLTINPGPASSANSSISISSGTVVSGNAATIVATIRDAYNNPLSNGSSVVINKSGGTSTGLISPLNNQGNGIYSATYTGILAGSAQTLSLNVDGTTLTPTTTIQVLPGAPVSANSILTVSAPTVLSGNSVNVSTTLRDINNNPVASGILVVFNKSGGTSSGNFTSLVNVGAGVYTTTYTGVTAGTAQNLTVSVDGVTLTPTATIQVLAGTANVANSQLTISNPTVVSGNFVTATATLKDINNNPIDSGVTVTFSKTGGTSTGTFGSVSNQGNGVYNIRYTGVKSGSAQDIKVQVNGVDLGPTVNVSVIPGAPSTTLSTISVSAATVVSGNSVTVTATLKDDNNNLVSSGVLVGISKTGGSSTGTLSSITNAGNGIYTATYTGIIAGSAQSLGIIVDGSALGPSTGISVISGAVNITNSSLVIGSATITSGSNTTITASLKDANNNPIDPASTVTFTKSGGTATGTFGTFVNQGGGVYTTTYTGVVAGTAQTIRVLIGGADVGFTVTVAVTPGSPSSTQSSISITAATVVSGDTVTATATIRDANSNPIPSGILVTFAKTGGTSTGIFSSVTNMGAGAYAINYQGVTSGSAQTLNVLVDGSALGPSTMITVTPGAPSSALSTLSVSSNTIISGGTSTLTATIRDANSNPISTGIVVSFDKYGGTSFGNLSVVTNQGNGVYTAIYTGVTAGTAQTVAANVNGTGFGPTQTIQVLVGAPNAAHSTLSVSPSTVASGSISTFSALIRDVNDNPITSEYAITFDTSGGSSTGTLGTVNNAGTGHFSNTYLAQVAGSAQTVRVLADGVPISGLTATVQVITGPVDATNSLFTIGSSTVQSGTTTNLNMNLRDANNNAIASGLAVTFIKSAGVSNGTISGVTNAGSGNYTATYTGTVQGAAQSITLVANGTTIPALNVSVTVTAGPPTQMTIAGPANPLNSIACNGPYTLTLKDAAANTTSSTSAFTMALSSAPVSSHVGTIYSDSSCTTLASSIPVAANVSSADFYYKSYVPQSITLTLTPSIGSIAAKTQALNNIAILSWLGTAGTFTMNGSGTTTVGDDASGAPTTPVDTLIDGDYLYAIDSSMNRIMKYEVSSGTLVGWLGHIASNEGISAYDGSASCSGLNITDMTPVWCLGGRSNTVTAAVINNLKNLAFDSVYIYVSTGQHRILRFNKTTGAYAGWIGRINVNPSSPAACVVGSGNYPGDWCYGGSSQAGSLDGHLNNPQGIVVRNGYIYVADYSNQRIQKLRASDGAPFGWVGLVNVAPQSWAGQLATCNPVPASNARTPGWCLSGTTGTAKVSDRYNLATSPSEVIAPDEGFKNPFAITADNNYIYVGDASNVRVVRLDITTGIFSGYIGGTTARSNPANQPSPAVGSGGYTSNWTQGGIVYPRADTTGFGVVRGISVDNNYLYISDDYQRVSRVQVADGQDFRWIGRVTTSPTGGYTGCSSTPVSGVNPGWCVNGAGNKLGNSNGAFYSPYGLMVDNTKLYVADVNNFRIQTFDKVGGNFTGWIGATTSTASRWTAAIPAGVSTMRAGIDDYSFGEIGTGYNSIAINTNYMFMTDVAFHRIKKFNRLDGTMIGYIGQIGSFPPTGPDSCVGFVSGLTPDWCKGGGRTGSGTGIHGYNNPYGVTADATYVYIANYSNHRVDRVNIDSALYNGWIGRINALPTDGDSTRCTDPAYAISGAASPNWCIGGSAQSGTTNGMMNAPRALYFDTYLYVTDNSGRLMKVNTSDGTFAGVVGNVTAGTGCTVTNNTASGWCTTATGGSGSNGYGAINAASGIAMNATYIYVSDTSGNRVTRYNKSTGAPAGAIAKLVNATNLNTTAGTGGYCASISGFPRALPGFCASTTLGQSMNWTAGAEEGAFNTPRGIWANDTYIYVADSANNRIQRFDAVTGAFAGWKGLVVTTAGMSDPACIAALGGPTPKWCFGGTSGPGKQLGAFDNPSGMTGDTNYLYVQDSRNNRTVTVPLN